MTPKSNDDGRRGAIFAGLRIRVYRLGSGEYEAHLGPAARPVAVVRWRVSEKEAIKRGLEIEKYGAPPVQAGLALGPMKGVGGCLFAL